MNKYILGFFVALLCLFGLNQLQAGDEPQLYVVTTTAQVADILTNISAPDVKIAYLMGTGVDPHLYRPTRSDVVKLKKADIIFYNGLHLEGQMIGLLEKLADEKPTIGLGDRLPEDSLIVDEEKAHDPHIWMNVDSWIKATDIVRGAMVQHDPDNKATYDSKARDYTQNLQSLDGYIKAVIKTIPEEKRILITAHDAFGYFGKAYNIEVIGIQGLSTASEAGLRRMEELVDLIVERQIPAIFAETSVSDRNIKALIEGAKARGHRVEIGGSLYSDAMGAEGTPEGRYIGMMAYNLNVITNALGGQAPKELPDHLFAQIQ